MQQLLPAKLIGYKLISISVLAKGGVVNKLDFFFFIVVFYYLITLMTNKGIWRLFKKVYVI